MFTQSFEELSIKTNGIKLIKITEKIFNFINRSKIANGILNIIQKFYTDPILIKRIKLILEL